MLQDSTTTTTTTVRDLLSCVHVEIVQALNRTPRSLTPPPGHRILKKRRGKRRDSLKKKTGDVAVSKGVVEFGGGIGTSREGKRTSSHRPALQTFPVRTQATFGPRPSSAARVGRRHADVRHGSKEPAGSVWKTEREEIRDWEVTPGVVETHGIYPLIDRGILTDGDFTPYLAPTPPTTGEPGGDNPDQTILFRQSSVQLHEHRERFVPFDKEMNPRGICLSTLRLDSSKADKKVAGTEERDEDGIGTSSVESPQNPACTPDERDRTDHVSTMPGNEVHELIIQDGTLMDASPSFEIFRSSLLDTHWGSAKMIVHRLQRLGQQYAIPIVQVRCDRVKALAAQNLVDIPTREQLLECVVNAEEVSAVLQRPGQRFRGRDGRTAAANRIAAFWRMVKVKRDHEKIALKRYAVRVITERRCDQLVARKMLADSKMTAVMGLVKCDLVAKKLPSNWSKYRTGKRTVIHLPSLSIPKAARASSDCVPLLQAMQLERILDLLDPDVTVIYVSPFPVEDSRLSLYKSFLGVSQQTDTEDRLKIVVPDNARFFPESANLTAMLLASHRAIQRVKNLIVGQPAYIIPGLVGHDDFVLSRVLGAPVLSPGPITSHRNGSKTGSRDLLIRSGVLVPRGISIPPAVRKIKDATRRAAATEFLNVVRETMYASRWIFKANDHFGGRGTAYLDVYNCKFYKALRQCRCSRREDGEKSERGSTEKHEKEEEEELVTLLLEDLTVTARLTDSNIYGSWSEYFTAFLSMGGVIECAPPVPYSSVQSPTAQVWIEGDGSFQLIGSQDQIFLQPYVYWGCLSPTQCLSHEDFMEPVSMIVKACHDSGILGNVEIDFVLYEHKAAMRLYCTGLKLGLSPKSSHSLFLQVAVGGRINSSSGLIQYDTNKARRLQLQFLSRVKHLDVKHLRQSTKTEDVDEMAMEDRVSLCTDRLWHTNFECMRLGTFNGLCLAHNMLFDEKLRLGTVFLPSYKSNGRVYLSMRCIAKSKTEVVKLLLCNLALIERMLTTTKLTGFSNFMPVAFHVKSKYLNRDNKQSKSPVVRVQYKNSSTSSSRRSSEPEIGYETEPDRTGEPSEKTLETFLRGVVDIPAPVEPPPPTATTTKNVDEAFEDFLKYGRVGNEEEADNFDWKGVRVVTLAGLEKRLEASAAIIESDLLLPPPREPGSKYTGRRKLSSARVSSGGSTRSSR